jgi:hypothetical protein
MFSSVQCVAPVMRCCGPEGGGTGVGVTTIGRVIVLVRTIMAGVWVGKAAISARVVCPPYALPSAVPTHSASAALTHGEPLGAQAQVLQPWDKRQGFSAFSSEHDRHRHDWHRAEVARKNRLSRPMYTDRGTLTRLIGRRLPGEGPGVKPVPFVLSQGASLPGRVAPLWQCH